MGIKEALTRARLKTKDRRICNPPGHNYMEVELETTDPKKSMGTIAFDYFEPGEGVKVGKVKTERRGVGGVGSG